MKRRHAGIVLILLSVLLICSCNMEPNITAEADRIGGIGIYAAGDVSNKYYESGSYAGFDVVVGENNLIVYNYSRCSTTVDLSGIDPSLGKTTVVISGQISFRYDAYPEMYPSTTNYNISFTYAGKTHSLEMKSRTTGVTSTTISSIKVDGVSYNPGSVR